MDYLDVVLPWLADQEPALPHIQKLARQIQRFEKNKDDFLRKEQEQRLEKVKEDFLCDFRNERETPRAAPLAAPATPGSTAAIHLTHFIPNNAGFAAGRTMPPPHWRPQAHC